MGIKKVPFNYEHPNKKENGRDDQTSPSTQRTTTTVESSKTAKKERSEVELRAKRAAQKCPSSDVEQTVTMRLVFYPPTTGEFKTYDKMLSSGLTPKQVILGLFKRGFSKFESNLLEDKISNEPTKSNKEGRAIETNRSVSLQFKAKAQQLFDPFGILTNRALGIKIGEAILAQILKDPSNG